MSGGEKYLLLAMDMAKEAGPQTLVKVFTHTQVFGFPEIGVPLLIIHR